MIPTRGPTLISVGVIASIDCLGCGRSMVSPCVQPGDPSPFWKSWTSGSHARWTWRTFSRKRSSLKELRRCRLIYRASPDPPSLRPRQTTRSPLLPVDAEHPATAASSSGFPAQIISYIAIVTHTPVILSCALVDSLQVF